MSAATNSIKIIVLGDPSTGKTSYCQRLSSPSSTEKAKRKEVFDIFFFSIFDRTHRVLFSFLQGFRYCVDQSETR